MWLTVGLSELLRFAVEHIAPSANAKLRQSVGGSAPNVTLCWLLASNRLHPRARIESRVYEEK